MKKLLAILLSAVLLLSCLPVFAYELPHSFWAMNNSYDSALGAKDYYGISQYGSQIVDLISQEPSNDQTDNIIGSRAYETAFAYYFIGDYENAVKYFNIYIPYGQKLGWSDGVRIAEGFVKQLPSSLELYKHTSQEQSYLGAKNEPHGVLYGQVSEESEADESAILLYLEYGNFDEFNWANVIFQKARDNGQAIELALNFPNQGDDARSISSSDAFLAQVRDILAEYSDVSVYLRIGAEMNIWGNQCTPDEFKNAFNTIASAVRHLPNVAIVWGIAHTDPWISESRPYSSDDYYPGDENVDYAGITIYCNKYFEGMRWQGVEEFNEICFKTGYSSDPVLMISDFVEKYGSRKPIMVSECGAAYYTQGEIHESHHDWAARRLKEMYSYVPMVYPQVKLMAYFNKKIPHEANLYDLNSSAELTAAYNAITESPWLIQGTASNTAETFFEHIDNRIITDGAVTLSAYPHLFGADSITVDYYLNGEWVGSAHEAPYTITIDNGYGALRVTATGSNGSVIDREYTIGSEGSDSTINTGSAAGGGEDDTSLFSDISSLTPVQTEALTDVWSRGIITGYEDKTFRPWETITRAEFATMICRMMGYPTDEGCTFDDAWDHWATKYIRACTDTGAINGIGNNLFAPDDNITIEQAFKIVTVTMKMADSFAEYPDGFISAATANGLADNLSTQDYPSQLTRIDAAVILSQALK